jgi:predicted DNA-binding WGR domain protein
MKFETLFALAANGKIAYYDVEVINNKLYISWGFIGSKMLTKTKTIAKGKNLGKSNATTPQQQAKNEAESILREKLDEGYKRLSDFGHKITKQAFSAADGGIVEFIIPDELGGRELKSLFEVLSLNLSPIQLDAEGRVKPMILHHLRLSTYPKGSKEYTKGKPIKYPCYVQPKKDGVCAVGSAKDGLITRGGKDRLTPGGKAWKDICPQIYKELKRLNYHKPLHGEVYLHSYTLDDITSACKKENTLSGKLQFIIFDVVDTSATFKERKEELEDLEVLLQSLDYKYLRVIQTFTVKNESELLDFETHFLSKDEEGLVARVPAGKYYPGERSTEVLKLVRFDSMELKVLDILPMENEPTHGIFVVDCETANGELLKVTPGEGFDDKKRQAILKNKKDYIGQLLTIRHRGFTQYGTPRIATGESLRHDL